MAAVTAALTHMGFNFNGAAVDAGVTPTSFYPEDFEAYTMHSPP